MAQQGTEAKSEPAGQEDSGQEGAGRHAAPDGSTSDAATTSEGDAGQGTDHTTEKFTTEKSSEQQTEKQQTEKQQTGKHQTEQPAERSSPSEQPTEKHEAARPGQADTSWAEDEHTGTTRHRSVDVGELAWRTGNVLATVVRTLALIFALVLVVNVVLVLVGVNPTNGVAQFVGAVANIVILGFRDLFLPASPVVMIIVNSLIAAAFWVFVGELLSRLIRFLAARVK